MAIRSYHIFLLVNLLISIPLWGASQEQDKEKEDEGGFAYSFAGDVAAVSKYIWRGQRLTDGWSLQPAATLGVGDFSFNVWGNLDLAAVNEGDGRLISENPNAGGGRDHDGLQGRFSEVDYTFSYALEAGPASLDLGTIFYTFPDRSSLATTVEVYGGFQLGEVPFAPSATLYVDVDETGDAGSTGLYFLMSAGHFIPMGTSRFPGLDFSSSLSVVNKGFSNFYYGAPETGFHDFNFTVTAPITISERLSAAAFISYSALLGEFRNHQFQNPRSLYLGTAGGPATFADTVWGGMTLSLSF